jgi:hypothetical protein
VQPCQTLLTVRITGHSPVLGTDLKRNKKTPPNSDGSPDQHLGWGLDTFTTLRLLSAATPLVLVAVIVGIKPLLVGEDEVTKESCGLPKDLLAKSISPLLVGRCQRWPARTLVRSEVHGDQVSPDSTQRGLNPKKAELPGDLGWGRKLSLDNDLPNDARRTGSAVLSWSATLKDSLLRFNLD